MRAGFKLEDGVDRRAVDQQLRWYASNPEYLQRAFGRADLYLYQIVTELERRGMPLELALLPVVESAFEQYAYLARARLGTVAVHSRYRLALWLEAGLVVRRPARHRGVTARSPRLPAAPAR